MRKANAMIARMKMIIGVGIPSTAPLPRKMNSGGKPVNGEPLVITKAIPSYRRMVPRVARMAGILTFATRKPLNRPHTSPTVNAVSMVTAMMPNMVIPVGMAAFMALLVLSSAMIPLEQ